MTIGFLKPRALTAQRVAELNGLLRAMRVSAFTPPSLKRWRAILAQRDTRFFVAREGKEIAGMCLLRWHDVSGGRAGILEDMVVSETRRGKGYGAALTKAVIDFAKHHGITYIDLTSRPERKAAAKLYEKFGWERRPTNVYRLTLS